MLQHKTPNIFSLQSYNTGNRWRGRIMQRDVNVAEIRKWRRRRRRGRRIRLRRGRRRGGRLRKGRGRLRRRTGRGKLRRKKEEEEEELHHSPQENNGTLSTVCQHSVFKYNFLKLIWKCFGLTASETAQSSFTVHRIQENNPNCRSSFFI